MSIRIRFDLIIFVWHFVYCVQRIEGDGLGGGGLSCLVLLSYVTQHFNAIHNRRGKG
jgi:hypothetical protein